MSTVVKLGGNPKGILDLGILGADNEIAVWTPDSLEVLEVIAHIRDVFVVLMNNISFQKGSEIVLEQISLRRLSLGRLVAVAYCAELRFGPMHP